MNDEINEKSVRMTSAQIITAIPRRENPEMKVYTVENIRDLINIRNELESPDIAELIVDIQVVHWDAITEE